MSIQKIYTEFSASITQVKDNPNKVLEEAGGAPVVVLANNTPRYYMVPPEMYALMVEALAAQFSELNPESIVKGRFKPGSSRLHQVAEQCARYLVETKTTAKAAGKKDDDFQEL